MKKILVPTDFSTEAENALKVAAQLARKHDAQIYLLHMIELPVDMVNPVGETRSNDLPEAIYFMKLAKKRFSEITSRPYLNGIEVFDTVDFHRAFDGIMETSRKHGCDFIVMGSKGATGFREMFVGSNTEKVVRTSEIPVLVIKKEHENFQIKNIVFATNLDSHNRKTLQKVIDFARLEDARLHLLSSILPMNSSPQGRWMNSLKNTWKGWISPIMNSTSIMITPLRKAFCTSRNPTTRMSSGWLRMEGGDSPIFSTAVSVKIWSITPPRR